MAAEALILEDAYQKGYADAMADMRKKKEQRQQREQAKKARRWYFIKQKACGLAMLAITVLAVWATEGDRGRHNNSIYYSTAGAYVPYQ